MTRDARLPALLASVAFSALLSGCEGRLDGEAPTSSFPNGIDNSSGKGNGSGNSSGNGSGGSGNPDMPPTTTPPVTRLPEATPCVSGSPGPRALRRLTAAEYDATLQDLFADPNVPRTAVFSDPSVLGFKVDNHALVIQGLGAQQLMDQAEAVAHWAVTTHLNKLTNCTTNDAGCRQSFIRDFGKRTHRAPLTDAEVTAYEQLFTAEASFNDGVEAVTSAMLQSPYFLYRRELGNQGGAGFELSGHELASALSYLFTGSMPDAELLAAADAGTLTNPAELERHAERLLQTPRGHQSVIGFMRDWLGLSKLDTIAKDDTVFKLSDTLRQAMGKETTKLIDDAVFSQNASFASLLTTRSTFVNRELATHYGFDNAGSLGDDLVQIMIDPAKRDVGLLAQGGLLTAHATAAESSPVQRGKMVRVRLLCEDLPPPPADVDTALKPAPGAKTTREHFAAHSENPVCASCHRLMDPIGYGFEHYDAFGRRREQENGVPVDATGAVNSFDGSSVPFAGLPGLTDYLTTQADEKVNACMVRYWSYFAFGAAGWQEDQCTYDAISQQAVADGYAIKSVVKAILKTPRFSRRVADQ